MADEAEMQRTGRYTKKKIEEIVDAFVESIFEGLGQADGGTLTKEQVKVCLQQLMEVHGMSEDWDECQFNELFNKFEDDEQDPTKV